MTATQAKPESKLNDFEGQPVHRATIAIRKAGDGLAAALDIEPVEIHKDEVKYYVIKTKCSSVGFPTDAHGITSRAHNMDTLGISPIDETIAEKVLQANAEEVQRKRTQIDGQADLFDAEAEASAREADDGSAPADEVAAKAAERAKRG